VRAVDPHGDEVHIGALATEVVETASELPDRFPGASRALGEEDQRVLVPEPLEHLGDGLAPTPVEGAADGVAVEQCAIDEDRVEDFADVVTAKPAPLPVVTPGDRPRLFPHVPRQRRPDQDEVQVARMVREEDALTGVVDPGGNNVTPNEYQALFKVWRDGDLTVRVAYSLCGMTDGSEFDEYKDYLALMPQGFGDEMLHFNGLGERVTWAMNGVSGKRPEQDKEKYYQIVRWAAGRGLTVTMHWNGDEKDPRILLRGSREGGYQLLLHAVGDRAVETVVEALEADGSPGWPERRLRLEHGDGVLPDLAPRARRFGLGVVQSPSHIMLPELILKRYGAQRAKLFQPLRWLVALGIPLALGSDGPLNPFLNLMFASAYPSNPAEALTREQALAAYTQGSAYAEFAEPEKGTLEPGKLADLAVLSQDIFQVPPPELPRTQSVLTLVGGKVVFDSGAIKR